MATTQKLLPRSSHGADSVSNVDMFPEGLRVLVVDHDFTCLSIVEKMLKKCSYVATTCSQVTVALELLMEKQRRFDLVLSDADLPDMSGFKLLKLASLEMDLPVIIMSADDRTSAVMRGITHGACDYLIKPMRVEELKNIWQHVVRKKWNKTIGQENFGSLDKNDWHRTGPIASEESSGIMQLIFEDNTEGLKVEEVTSQQVSPIKHLLLEDGCQDSGNERVDRLEEEEEEVSPVKCIKHQFLTSQPERYHEILEDPRYNAETDYFTPEMNSEEAKKHKEEIVATKRIYEQVEESPVEDVGYTTSSRDVGYALNTATVLSSFSTLEALPQQKVEKEAMVSNTLAQKPILHEKILQINNLEQDDKTLNFVSKTSIQGTSERAKQSENDISFESIKEHFGRPLDDVAKHFGVSRSTFKRICRGLGIKRWQYGKRRMDGNVSSKIDKTASDQEARRTSLFCSGMPPVQDTDMGAHTSRDLNKMSVKATYNGVTIRFEVLGLSGIVELEDNVIERLHLEKESFSIKYQDDEGDWVLMACDKDVHQCIEMSRSLNKTTVKLLVDRPINHYAP